MEEITWPYVVEWMKQQNELVLKIGAVAVAAVGQAATKRHFVFQADIFFEKEKDT
jgi:hypothetical protein